MHLSEYDLLEQVDLIEAERRDLFIDFGREAIKVLSTAKDHDHAMSLIGHLRKIFFVDEGQKDHEKISKQADELIRMGSLTYTIEPKKGGASLVISNK